MTLDPETLLAIAATFAGLACCRCGGPATAIRRGRHGRQVVARYYCRGCLGTRRSGPQVETHRVQAHLGKHRRDS